MEVQRPVVAVDIDEVLCRFVAALNAHANKENGTVFSESDFHSYTFRDVWNCEEEESARRVQSYLASSDFANGLEVLPGAKSVLSRLSLNFDLVVVTSRQLQIEDVTREYIQREFPGIFKKIYFGNHWGLHGEKKSKPEMCVAANAVCLIDDSTKYAVECASVLKRVLLFGNYPWNDTSQGPGVPENVVRVASWSDVESALLHL